jgi:rubredoxin
MLLFISQFLIRKVKTFQSNNIKSKKDFPCSINIRARYKKNFLMVTGEKEQKDPETIKEEERLAEIERLRAAEKFMEIDEGKHECQACGYTYEPEKGDRFAGIIIGTKFEELPTNFSCPACRSPKTQFRPIKKIIAGFAENQKYGLGGNSLTGGQKNLLIFGALGTFFFLLLSGYLLE